MPFRGRKDGDGRQTFSKLFGKSRPRAPPPSSVPKNTPPVPPPILPPTIPPSVQAPIPTSVQIDVPTASSQTFTTTSVQASVPTPAPTAAPTAVLQPSTSHDPVSDSLAPAAGPSSVVAAKSDVDMPAHDPLPRSPILSTSTPAPPVVSKSTEAIRAEAEMYKHWGNQDANSGDFQNAADQYSRAIQLQPSNAEYLANRSYAYYALSRYRDAIIDARASVAAKPTYSKGWSRLGAAHKALGEYADAKAAYTEALRTEKSELVAKTIANNLAQLEERGMTAGWRSATGVPSVATGASGTRNTSSPRPLTSIPPRPASSTPIPRSTPATFRPTLSTSSSLWPPLPDQSSTPHNTSSPRPLTPIPSRPASSAPIPRLTPSTFQPTTSSTNSSLWPPLPGPLLEAIPPSLLFLFPPTSSTSSLSAPIRPATISSPQTSPQSVPSSSQVVSPSSQRPVPVTRGPSVIPAQAVARPPIMTTPSTSRTIAHPTTPAAPSSEADTTESAEAKHHKTLGNEAVACRNFEKAVREYTSAIQLDPSSAIYLANRSYAYFSLSKYQDARIDAEKAVTADPDYWKGWARLGSAHKALEQYSDAKKAFERALQVRGPVAGADITKKDLVEVTSLLDKINARSSVLTSRSGAATTTNNPSQRVTTAIPSGPTISSPAVSHATSSTSIPPGPAPFSPTSDSARSIPVSATPESAAHSFTTQPPAMASDLSADPPPAYRPSATTLPDPVSSVPGQELNGEWDELESKIAARNTGALSFSSVSLNGHVSYVVSLTGRESQYTWDKDLDLVKIAHPAFALYHLDELEGSTLHQADPEMNRKFTGLVPGTVSITGYCKLISEHIRATTRRTVTTLSSIGPLPVLPGSRLLARIDRLRIGLEFTDLEASLSLRQLLGPDQTTWGNPADRFKLSNQIMNICMALNRQDIFDDFTDATSIAHRLLLPPPAGMGMWDFVLQIVLGYELHLRLKKDGGSWYSGINNRVSATMLISKLWIDNVDMSTEDDGYVSNNKFRSRVQARQIEGLLRFAELMKWPHLSEMRDFMENAYIDLVGGKTLKIDVWDWLFGLILPGWYYSWKIMSVLVMATPSLNHHGTMQFINSGFNLGGRSWWRSRVVLGSVLAGLRGVKSVCGWIGPCTNVTDPPEMPWIRIRARPIEFTCTDPFENIGDAASDDESSEEESYGTSRGLFVPREGETMFDIIQDLSDMSQWTEPVPPPKVHFTCSVSKILLKALPHETTGIIDRNDPRTEYQASVIFQLAGMTGISDATYTLYTNPTFISAHPCIGTHVAHRRQMPQYTDKVVSVKDLKSYEGDGGGRKVLVINAQCDGGEAVARAWCAEKGQHAVVSRGKGTCFMCSVLMTQKIAVGVLIWS